MATIIGISGSLRTGSYNTALLRTAAELAPASLRIESESIRDIPLYNADVEAQGMPAAVTRLKERIAAADGLLLVTPEYDNSIPGVMKNAIDWLGRPPADIARVFAHKPVALMGATPGRMGTAFSQVAWLQVLAYLNLRPFFGVRVYVSNAGKVFDPEGRLTDTETRKLLTSYMNGFAEFVTAK